MRRLLLATLVLLILSCCGPASLAGTASGTCRVRYGGAWGERPETHPRLERVDPITMRLEDTAGGGVRIRMNGCDLSMTRAPAEPDTNPHFLIVHGSACDWDLPGAGAQHFSVEHIPDPHTHTDSTGDVEAYANVSEREVFLRFAAVVSDTPLDFDCEATR